MENIQQGSSSWHDWRAKGIGASEAPAIMGESPYQTALQLWEVKTKRRPPQETNFAMARGTAMEPQARALFELTYNIEMTPVLAEHAEYPFIRASLDGFNKDLNIALEIKCCGKKNFELIESGKVPLDYKAQIQQQILVSGVEFVYLYGYNGKIGACLKVYPDIEYCRTLLSELIKFWNCVQTDTPPEADPKRDYEIIQDETLEKYVSEWKIRKSLYEDSKLALDEIEEKIRSGLQVSRGLCQGVRLTKSTRKGSIKYSSLPQLQGIDLEPYRSAPTETFSIKMIK